MVGAEGRQNLSAAIVGGLGAVVLCLRWGKGHGSLTAVRLDLLPKPLLDSRLACCPLKTFTVFYRFVIDFIDVR